MGISIAIRMDMCDHACIWKLMYSDCINSLGRFAITPVLCNMEIQQEVHNIFCVGMELSSIVGIVRGTIILISTSLL